MKRVLVIGISVFLAACAGPNYRPMIDSRNVDMNKYEADLRDCQQYAGQVGGAGEGAAIGAGIGALLSFGLAVIGGNRYDQGRSAAGGALLGAASGAGVGETSQHDVIRRCMAGRGYSVLQ